MSDQDYIVRWKGVQSGPYTLEQILRMLDDGKVSMSHEVMVDGKWQTLDELVSKKIPPPLPPTPAFGEGGGERHITALQDSSGEAGYGHGAVDVGLTRPVSVVTLGILNIVLGSLALLALPLGVLGLLAMLGQSLLPYIIWWAFTLFFDLVLKTCLLVFGIGLLKRASWARRGCIIYAWCALGAVLLDLMVALIFFAVSPPLHYGGFVAMVVAARLFLALLAAIYPIVLLALLSRPKVANYFDG